MEIILIAVWGLLFYAAHAANAWYEGYRETAVESKTNYYPLGRAHRRTGKAYGFNVTTGRWVYLPTGKAVVR